MEGVALAFAIAEAVLKAYQFFCKQYSFLNMPGPDKKSSSLIPPPRPLPFEISHYLEDVILACCAGIKVLMPILRISGCE